MSDDDDGDLVGLEEVGRHAGAVTDVVAHVVGDGGGVAGSSSGMPASTLPTRSAPTSAALVKMPPPTRMNRASSEAPKAKPMSTAVAEFWKIRTMRGGADQAETHAEQPGDGPGAEGHLEGAGHAAALEAAAAVRTLPRTAMLMPMKPVRPEKVAPKRKQMTR